MSALTRRSMVQTLAAALFGPALPLAAAARDTTQPFGPDTVIDRARELAGAPFDSSTPQLPESIRKLSFDSWRNIRFRPDRSLLRSGENRFRLQAFHLGHLFLRPIALNVVHDGVSAPLRYSANQFDYGGNQFPSPLPEDLGFAGFRINTPLNKPKVFDELISFVGASYFRLLGKGQSYGLSARGLSIGSGRLDDKEEFPFFREFWFEAPAPGADSIVFHALLDSPSVAGAYRFDLKPGEITTADITANLFPRVRVPDFGIAPLTSMYFIGENDRHYNDRNKYDDYRPEMHDSDGLLIHTEKDEWIWRPLRNPFIQEVSQFQAPSLRGFGLMQRDRDFSHYQDLELAYQVRPSYWIEPIGDWGQGRVELIELATKDETADNIVCAFIPGVPAEPGQRLTYRYKLSSGLDFSSLNGLAQTLNTFHAPVGALGSNERRTPGSRRFLVDFAGGSLTGSIDGLELVTKASAGEVLRSFIAPNPEIKGVRAFIDVRGEPGRSLYLKASLRRGNERASETWAYRWVAE
jgi:glucans biosynthesis protein